MNIVAILNTQFVQIALPIVITLFLASWLNKKRLDDMNRRFDEVIKRLDKIDVTLLTYGERAPQRTDLAAAAALSTKKER